MENASLFSRRLFMTFTIAFAFLFGYANTNAVSSFRIDQTQQVERGKGGELGEGTFVCKQWGESYYVRCGAEGPVITYVINVFAILFVLPLLIGIVAEPAVAATAGIPILALVAVAAFAWLLSKTQTDLPDGARRLRTISLALLAAVLGLTLGLLFPTLGML